MTDSVLLSRQDAYYLCKMTLPFLSMRSLQAFNARKNNYFDTAIDDLESFFWVLIYAVLLIAENRGPLDQYEKLWLDCLTSRDGMSQMLKDSFVDDLHEAKSPVLVVFVPILQAWRNVMVPARAALRDKLQHRSSPDLAFCHRRYKRYLDIGFSQLQNLPATWDEIVVDQPQ